MLLTDDVLIEGRGDDLRVRDRPGLASLGGSGPVVLLEDLLAQVDALVADVDTRTGDEFLDLPLGFTAEAAEKLFVAVACSGHLYSL